MDILWILWILPTALALEGKILFPLVLVKRSIQLIARDFLMPVAR